ncbi:hypothetical protein EDC19_1393 [Natranaerovirga hydrolytica]|uniref:Uncharacterized protein n=1 Tax=Natranaerovirga hydrolytica TaxID=680378 RepID=A0A4R1MTC4_9FIRM|nr:hypothetical protein [Natranaerovirga hydrolytica]TCK93203.1 hypothetical protein EDC19_1393 [Natranaerovirga hydrolytica]
MKKSRIILPVSIIFLMLIVVLSNENERSGLHKEELEEDKRVFYSKEEVLEIFNNNKEEFETIKKYAIENNDIYISYNYNEEKYINKRNNIQDIKVRNKINYILNAYKCTIISTHKNGNIEFVFPGSYMISILYVVEGELPNITPDIGILEHIEENWYVYAFFGV